MNWRHEATNGDMPRRKGTRAWWSLVIMVLGFMTIVSVLTHDEDAFRNRGVLPTTGSEAPLVLLPPWTLTPDAASVVDEATGELAETGLDAIGGEAARVRVEHVIAADRLFAYERLLRRGHRRFEKGNVRGAARLFRKAARLVKIDSRAWWALAPYRL